MLKLPGLVPGFFNFSGCCSLLGSTDAMRFYPAVDCGHRYFLPWASRTLYPKHKRVAAGCGPRRQRSCPARRASRPSRYRPHHLCAFPRTRDSSQSRRKRSQAPLFVSSGKRGQVTAWRKTASALEYERDFEGGIHLLARAILENDGVRFRYEFTNKSESAYELVYAPTDPRLTGIFHDVRVQRTFVHRVQGFDLLASETPQRLSMPLDQWLPARYLDSFTWPVPKKLIDRRDDITYYNNSHPVDEPLIATVSSDRRWVVASFAATTGNVWSN